MTASPRLRIPIPGWALVETGEPDGDLTGRRIDGLIESVLLVEPEIVEEIFAGFDKPERPKAQ